MILNWQYQFETKTIATPKLQKQILLYQLYLVLPTFKHVLPYTHPRLINTSTIPKAIGADNTLDPGGSPHFLFRAGLIQRRGCNFKPTCDWMKHGGVSQLDGFYPENFGGTKSISSIHWLLMIFPLKQTIADISHVTETKIRLSQWYLFHFPPTRSKSQSTPLGSLVGGLEHVFLFHILGIIILTDELIFFRGVGWKPTNQHWSPNFWILESHSYTH